MRGDPGANSDHAGLNIPSVFGMLCNYPGGAEKLAWEKDVFAMLLSYPAYNSYFGYLGFLAAIVTVQNSMARDES